MQGVEPQEVPTVLDGISIGKVVVPDPVKTIGKLSDDEKESPKVETSFVSDEVESNIEVEAPTKEELPKPKATRAKAVKEEAKPVETDNSQSLNLDQVIAEYEKIFAGIVVPDIRAMMVEAASYSLELPQDVADNPTLMYINSKNASYRNKLVEMQVNLRRVANVLTRTFKSMLKVLQGMSQCSSADKRIAEAILKTAKYEQEVGRVQDALDAIETFIENTDAFASSLRTMVKLFESPGSRMFLQGGDGILENDLTPKRMRKSFPTSSENDEI